MITLLLVDYPLAVRRALRARLSLEPDMCIVGEADDALQALSLTRSLGPAVVLVDAETPDLDVAALTRALLNSDEMPSLIVLSQHCAAVKHMLRESAVVVVGRHEGWQRLVGAIRSVADAWAHHPTE